MSEVKVPDSATIIEVDGIKFSREIFKVFADQATNGDLFRFIKKENGTVTVEKIYFKGKEVYYCDYHGGFVK